MRGVGTMIIPCLVNRNIGRRVVSINRDANKDPVPKVVVVGIWGVEEEEEEEEAGSGGGMGSHEPGELMLAESPKDCQAMAGLFGLSRRGLVAYSARAVVAEEEHAQAGGSSSRSSMDPQEDRGEGPRGEGGERSEGSWCYIRLEFKIHLSMALFSKRGSGNDDLLVLLYHSCPSLLLPPPSSAGIANTPPPTTAAQEESSRRILALERLWEAAGAGGHACHVQGCPIHPWVHACLP